MTRWSGVGGMQPHSVRGITKLQLVKHSACVVLYDIGKAASSNTILTAPGSNDTTKNSKLRKCYKPIRYKY